MDKERIKVLDWAYYSAGLNPIENIWRAEDESRLRVTQARVFLLKNRQLYLRQIYFCYNTKEPKCNDSDQAIMSEIMSDS